MHANLNIISEMKNVLFSEILGDSDIVKLLRNSAEASVPDRAAAYEYVYPWTHAPDTQTEARTIITFDISVTRILHCAAKEFALMVYIMTHDSLMRVGAEKARELGISDTGIRPDIIADKIDTLINGSTRFGFDKLELRKSVVFEANTMYHGRMLEYRVYGWNRTGDTL